MSNKLNQQQYDLICKIIANGAPALAKELISALSNTINEYNRLAKAEDDRNSVKPEKVSKASK